VTDHAEAVADGQRGGRARRAQTAFGALVHNWINLIFRQNQLNAFVFGYHHVSVLPTPGDARRHDRRHSAQHADAGGIAFSGSSALAFCTQYAKIAE
jgi:hypothetical protein